MSSKQESPNQKVVSQQIERVIETVKPNGRFAYALLYTETVINYGVTHIKPDGSEGPYIYTKSGRLDE